MPPPIRGGVLIAVVTLRASELYTVQQYVFSDAAAASLM